MFDLVLKKIEGVRYLDSVNGDSINATDRAALSINTDT